MAHDSINVLAVCLTQLATGHVLTDSPAKRTTFRSHLALRRLRQEDVLGHRYQKEESADDLISDAPISPRVTPVTAIYTDSQLHTRLCLEEERVQDGGDDVGAGIGRAVVRNKPIDHKQWVPEKVHHELRHLDLPRHMPIRMIVILIIEASCEHGYDAAEDQRLPLPREMRT
ncbi:hypothetical protein DYB31_008980 [Aphanomyces astaci]|uniref:Uncharacterized protein n=1 Tax=Aphanomyces astaci TaxID=112090 RepID=A0A397F2N1_APHAT|nr:hypothetical protein DYB31_008980 [Aphanomyces astaci]